MSPKRQALPVTIDGTTYDVSAWINHHPGGADIIENYRNRDATDVFMVMHSQEAVAKLKRMPVMEPSSPDTPVAPKPKRDEPQEDFRKLREELISKGMMEANPVWYLYKSSTTAGLMVLSILMTVYTNWYFTAAVVLGVCYQQLGWLAHDYCHHQVFKNRNINNAFGLFFGNLMSGFSVTWWKDRHNGHHAATNVVGHDPDIDNLPLLAWSPEDVKNADSKTRNMIKYQQYYFLPTIATLRFIWCTQSILGVMSYKTDEKNLYYKRQYTKEITLLALHWVLKAVFYFSTMPSFAVGLGCFLLSELLGGFGIAIVVFLNHYPLEKVEETVWDDHGFSAGQIHETLNIKPGLLTDWVFGGLNYQIEHHLWPNMPRHNLTATSVEVKKLCQKHNLPYRAPAIIPGIQGLLSFLGEIGQLAAVPE